MITLNNEIKESENLDKALKVNELIKVYKDISLKIKVLSSKETKLLSQSHSINENHQIKETLLNEKANIVNKLKEESEIVDGYKNIVQLKELLKNQNESKLKEMVNTKSKKVNHLNELENTKLIQIAESINRMENVS